MSTLASINPVPRLRHALMQWKCPACGGKKIYINRGYKKDGKRVEGTVQVGDMMFNEELPCTKCKGTGLHPIAQEALFGSETRDL